MRMILPVLLFLSSCSMPETQRSENSNLPVAANVEMEQAQDGVNGSAAAPAPASGGARQAELPYLAVRKASGPALQALMQGRLEVQGGCVVFVEPGAKPKLAVFHPPASLRRSADGGMAVASLNFEIPIGRDVRVGGGALPPGDDLDAALRAPVADRCPDNAVEIGELVR